METENGYIGKQIGNYRITASLDAGAFGTVYRGVHIYLANREVAIKLMHRTHLASEHERESFLQEAQFLEVLKHPHILPIYDVGIDEGTPYIIAEFAPNGSLRDLIKARRPALLSQEEVLTILSQVGQALDYVHQQNFVHRDLKPENILFDARGDALIADFGIAVFLETTKTAYVDIIGSPLYMAPEQFEGFASRRSDQYALACIAYELLTGRPPIVGQHAVIIGVRHQTEPPTPPRQLNPAIPVHIENALLKALSKKREERYPDIPAFLAALLNVPTRVVDKADDALEASAIAHANSIPLSIFTPNAEIITRTKEQWADEGNDLYNRGRYEEALSAFEHAIQKDPTFAYAHEGKTSALYALERYQEALTSVEIALKLAPEYAISYADKGNILYEFQCYDDALGYYDRALQLDPQLVDAYLGRATTLCAQRRYQEALDAYEQAIQLDPANSLAYDGEAWTLRQLQRFTEALTFSEKAIQLDPQNASYHMGKGRALFRLQRYEESLVSFDLAIQLDPLLAQIYDYKADSLYQTKRLEEALETYEHAFQLDPQMASSYEGKGNVLYHFQRYEEALAAYEQSIMLEPRNGFFVHRKADVLKVLGRLEEAQVAEEQAHKLGYK